MGARDLTVRDRWNDWWSARYILFQQPCERSSHGLTDMPKFDREFRKIQIESFECAVVESVACQNTQEPKRSTAIRIRSVSYSTEITCIHSLSTDFNKSFDPVRDQVLPLWNLVAVYGGLLWPVEL
jgi:hypothetical protein